MTIFQIQSVWTGFTGAPGYTNLHVTNAGLRQTAIDNGFSGVVGFWDTLKGVMCDQVTVTVNPEVKEFDPVTGDLISIGSASSAPISSAGLKVGLGPAPAGACISWGTGAVHRGRLVRGRTFLVPLGIGCFQTDGTMTSGDLATINTAATDYRTSAAYESVIWARPTVDPDTGDTVPNGQAYPIVSSTVRDKVAVLRSRRD